MEDEVLPFHSYAEFEMYRSDTAREGPYLGRCLIYLTLISFSTGLLSDLQ